MKESDKKPFKWVDEKEWQLERDHRKVDYIAGIDPIRPTVTTVFKNVHKQSSPSVGVVGKSFKLIFEEDYVKNTSFDKPLITAETIRKLLDDNMSKFRRPGNRKIILYTGENGYRTFNYIMLFGDDIHVYHVTHNFNRINTRYISLFKKSGLYKMKIIDDVIEVYKGTEMIKRFSDCRHIWNFNDTKSDIDKAKLTITAVNKYLKTLN